MQGATTSRETQRACCQRKVSLKRGERSSSVKSVTQGNLGTGWQEVHSKSISPHFLIPWSSAQGQCCWPMLFYWQHLRMDPSTWRKPSFVPGSFPRLPSESFIQGAMSVSIPTEFGGREAERISLKESPDLTSWDVALGSAKAGSLREWRTEERMQRG